VLTDERFRREHIDHHRNEFFASGVRDVARFLDRYERSFGKLPTGTALDFGCGVGRLSLALASRFDRVIGLDVAPAMLEEARANAAEFGFTNLTFSVSDDELTKAPGEFDFVVSYIVLQHIPSARGMAFVARLIDKVRPGGGCMLHLSVQRGASTLRRLGYWARFHVPGVHELSNLKARRPLREPAMQMNEYPLARVLGEFHSAGMTEIVVTTEYHGGSLTTMLTGHKPLRGG
jgi:SAM-dependent methyltransferase